MTARRTAPASGRVYRVAELIDADPDRVRQAVRSLPGRVRPIVAEVPAGVLLTLEVRLPWWDRRARRTALVRLSRTLRNIERRTQRRTVVAAALIVDRKVLVAQRAMPPQLAGQWEFPGGKVERGETRAAALMRECCEELGCQVAVGPELGRGPLADRAELVLFHVSLLPGSPQPRALENQDVRWLSARELEGLDWVGSNGRYVTEVTARL
ncbi:(deoxy)nucleoside triphosphate pyrophosphohydrolase [Jatrophihabitans lederbergiae]|jgi:8-oxo-dGTP diphosphatase|uniref:8-oxo-dGTP diphosphatase n=1 Tax=Jatrophihabitans lederbergiae TaxID=3075547 RepID=A0ABU2JBE5_9ACTN|nr:NUDIX domain-containing protein [Jatrophihabitans sp. DSM 44399]MDT0261799.1 NUDIX domain-containing protein [Jatrophihabitans sp. DSM 44399]